jgi:hypothetical protein
VQDRLRAWTVCFASTGSSNRRTDSMMTGTEKCQFRTEKCQFIAQLVKSRTDTPPRKVHATCRRRILQGRAKTDISQPKSDISQFTRTPAPCEI